MKIEKENGEVVIKSDNDQTINQEKEMTKQKQFTLKPNNNTIYSSVA